MKKLPFFFVWIISFYPGFSQVDIDYFNNQAKRLIINNQAIPLQEAYMIGISYDQLLAIKRTSTNFDRELLNYYQYIEDIKSPYELMDEYDYIKAEIEVWGEDLKNKNTAQINAEVDVIWYGGEKLLNGLGVNTQAKTEGNAILLAIVKEGAKEIHKQSIKKKRDKEIEDAKRRAKRQLEQALDKKLKPIRDNIIVDNDSFKQSYTKAAAYAHTKIEQDYYLQLARYHESISTYVRRNYTTNNLNWLSPNINKPLTKYFEPDNQNVDFAFVALMKYNFYQETKIDVFNESFQKYLDAGINQNPNNAELFVLKSKAETDVIEKYKYANYAYNLVSEKSIYQYQNSDIQANQKALYKPNIRNIETQYQKTKKAFEDYIFDGIKYNKPYINKYLQAGYHVGLQNESYETPMIIAIRYDQEKLLETMINKNISPVEEINARGHFYLLYAVTNKSESCIDKLLQYGVDLNYAHGNGLSALSIAILQKNSNVVEMLLKKGANKDAALKYIAYNKNSNTLDKSCVVLYNYDQKNIQTILKYNPNFFKNNYGSLSIKSSEDDAKIFVDNEFVGLGSVNIGKIEKSDALNIEIQKNGMKREVFTIPVVKNKTTYIDINMVKWIPLKKLLSTEDISWKSFYYEPSNLKPVHKTYAKRFWRNFAIFAPLFAIPYAVLVWNEEPEIAITIPIVAGSGFGALSSYAFTRKDKKVIRKNKKYNNGLRLEAEGLARLKVGNEIVKQNQSIKMQNKAILEKNSNWLNKRSVKYKVGVGGEYIYIVKPTASGDVLETNFYKSSKPVSNITVSFPFLVSKSKYSSHYNLEEKAALDCGVNYRIADWNDLITYEQDIEKLAEYLNMSNDEYKSLYITKDGERLYYNDRQYFIALQNHNKPSNWMTHGNIDNHFISLGSWINKNYHILCIKKQ